jgi:putative oxidoreductase
MSKNTKILSWSLRIVTALILLQTLYFKFTAHPDSVFIFSQIGMEPAGRIGSGIAELIAGLLLLVPATAGIGACISLGVISGAIFFHLTKLGISIDGDTSLFFLACVVFLFSFIIGIIHRKEIPLIKNWV